MGGVRSVALVRAAAVAMVAGLGAPLFAAPASADPLAHLARPDL